MTTKKTDLELADERIIETESDSEQQKPSFFGRNKLKTIALVGSALSCLVIAVYLFLPKNNTPVNMPPPEVEVVETAQENVPVYKTWTGTTDGMVNTEIRAQVSGYLLRQNYTEGSFVKKGQLLFEIDPRPFQAALEQAQGKLAESKGKLAQAEAQLAQTQAQVGQAQAQVEQAQAQVLQAQAQRAQAQAQVAQAEANQRKTQMDVNKYRPLREQKAVTQQELDNAVEANDAALAQISAAKAQIEAANAQTSAARAVVSTNQAQVKSATAQTGAAKAAIVAARAAVESAEADVKTVEINLGFTRIFSPIDGIAGIAKAQVGNLLDPASGALTTVSSVDPIKVYFAMSEQEYLATYEQNQTQASQRDALRGLQLELILADGSTYPQTGRFFVTDRQVDEKTGTIRLAGIFSNPNNILRPGQFGQIRAVTSVKENALTVPQRAVSELQGINQVAVVNEENKVDIRTVKTGDEIDAKVVITEGLKPGEKVIVSGIQKVAPGAVVVPKPFVPTESAAK